MDLKTVKKVTPILFVILFVNVFVGWITDKTIFGIIAIAMMCIQSFIYMAYWNCPSCGRNLGAIYSEKKTRYCSYCGEEIKM